MGGIEHTLRMESATSTRARIVAAAQGLREADAPAELTIGEPVAFAPLPRRAFAEMHALVTLTRAAGIARSLRARAEARLGRSVAAVAITVPIGKPVLHQVIQSIRPFDAVSNDALAIQALLRGHGTSVRSLPRTSIRLCAMLSGQSIACSTQASATRPCSTMSVSKPRG